MTIFFEIMFKKSLQMLKNVNRHLYFAMRHAIYSKMGRLTPIKTTVQSKKRTAVDLYWRYHTVNSKAFKSTTHSKQYLEWRFSVYPLFKEFSGLYGEHNDQVILDYGCGPGDDLTGFALYSRAKKIIGMDISEKVLVLAQYRLALHRVDPERIELIHTSDESAKIELESNSIDHVNCQGVLMHTPHIELILKEFYRVLKPNSTACIMVYNADSLWLHLYTAYERMVLQGAFAGLTVYEAFSKNTDGEECPVSRCYRSQEFISMCKTAGFEEVKYAGGYLSDTELNSLNKYGQMALEDERLSDEHKAFLRKLEFDARGLPMYNGKHAGIGGVYHLLKK